MKNDTAIAKRNEAPTPAENETSAVLNMIERAARDESVNVDKLRQLLEMRSQIEAKNAEREFDMAMSATQSEMLPVAVDSNNPQTRSKYASYFALDKALRPIYTTHGFALSFGTSEGAPEQMVRVQCRVSHKNGHSRAYHIDMPADGKGAKGGDVMTRTHATGSAVSYGMRYLLKMIFNISVGEDDGNAAAETGGAVTEAQLKKLIDLSDKVGADKEKFCKYFKIEGMADLPVSKFNIAVQLLEAKGRQG